MPFRRVAALSPVATSFSDFLSAWNSITDMDYDTHKKVFSLCWDELPVTQIIQNYFKHIRTEYSQRDRYSNRGEFMEALVLGSKIKALYERLLQDNGSKISDTVLYWMGEELQGHISAWTSELKLRVCPRPTRYNQLVQVSTMIDISRDWVASFPLQLRVANSNGTIFFALGYYGISLLDQIIDNIASSVSRLYDRFLLSGDREVFMQDLGKLITVLSFRFQTYGRCMQIMKRSVALCSDLKAISDESLQEFLVYLETCGKFVIERKDKVVVEFLSISLQDPEKRRIFDEAICDFSFALTDDFRIKVYQGGARHGDIYVESRHSWVKDKWVSEVSHSFGLQIINSGYSPTPKLNLWMMNVRSRLEMVSLAAFWVTNILEDEGFLTVDPVTNIVMYCIACAHSAETLLNPISLLVSSTGMLWTATMLKMGAWLGAMEKLIGTEWLMHPWKKLTFCMNFVSQLIRKCPKNMHLHGLVEAMKTLVHLLRDDADDEAIDKSNECINEKLILKEMTVKCIAEASNLELKEFEPCGSTEVKYLYPLGKGSFSQVYRCYDPVLNCAIALKVVTVPDADAVSSQHVASEIGHLAYINHRNIIRLYGYVVQGNTTFLKMELCDGGSLQDLIGPGKLVELQIFRGISHQILLGLSFLHANQIIHGDLKPANILRDSFGKIKLADFGTSCCLINSARHKTVGTLLYTAPEVLLGEAASPLSDLWSVGCTLFHLATGISPWADCETAWQIMLKASQKQCFDLTPLHQCSLPQEAKDIILACLKIEPTSRPYITELLITKYFFDPE